MRTYRQVNPVWPVMAVAVLLALGAAAAQAPPESFGDEVVVRETSIAVRPPGSGATLPPIDELSVAVDGLFRQVTRVEPMLEDKRGSWQFVVYLDPRLAGERTRFLASLALAERAESLAAMGSVEVLEAEAVKPVLARTDSWQRIEAALLGHALEAKYRLARGGEATERPGWELFRDRLELMLAALEGRGADGPRALFVPSDGLFAMAGSEEFEQLSRALAAAGWVTVPMPWSEEPDESSAARLSEFESWKQSAEGRDGSAGTRQYVIDLGRVVQRLRGAMVAPIEERAEVQPWLVALHHLSGSTSGLVAGGKAELRAALSDLARRWRVWFQTWPTGVGEPARLEVRLRDKPLGASDWFRLPPVE